MDQGTRRAIDILTLDRRGFSTHKTSRGKRFRLVQHESGDKSQLLRVNDLGEPCYATPAIAGGRIYQRTGKSLYCFGK